MEVILYSLGMCGFILSAFTFVVLNGEINIVFLISMCIYIIIQSILMIAFGVLISLGKEIVGLLKNGNNPN